MDKPSELVFTGNQTELDYGSGPDPVPTTPFRPSRSILAMDHILMPHELDECCGPALTPAR